MKKISLFIGILSFVFSFSFVLFTFAQNAFGAETKPNFEARPKVIYGDDNRQDYFEVSDRALLEVADSTVAVVNSAHLKPLEEGWELVTTSFGQDMSLCNDERFFEQPTAAYCSGFLVAPDLVVTAGHCVADYNCDKTNFIFGFQMQDSTRAVEHFSKDQVYQCKKVVKREQQAKAQDYALVRLDRKVKNYKQLVLRTKRVIEKGDELVIVGHPSGLPMKIANGATVRDFAKDKSYFVANTDSYGGNSGSAIFNRRTLEVEGILVRGYTDFQYDSKNSCMRSMHCPEDGCDGEEATDISFIVKLLTKR